MADPTAIACAACGWVGDLHEHHLVPRPIGLLLPTVKLCPPCHGLVHGHSYPLDHIARTRAGIERAKLAGKYKGRAPTARRQVAQMRELVAEGVNKSEIARRLGMHRSSVHRVLAAG
jgi:hypothetical protein